MQKRLTRYLLLLLVLVATILVFKKGEWLTSFTNIFKSKPLTIENTAIVVKEINALAQLITITAYNEVVMEEVIKGNSLFNNPVIPTLLNVPDFKYADRKLVLIGKGKVLAGINLASITDKDVFIQDDSIAINLPKAQVLQVIINPSDFETFEETGKWSDAEVTAVKLKLRDKLVITVLRENILQKAEAKAKLVMENFITSVGYKKVTLTFKM